MEVKIKTVNIKGPVQKVDLPVGSSIVNFLRAPEGSGYDCVIVIEQPAVIEPPMKTQEIEFQVYPSDTTIQIPDDGSVLYQQSFVYKVGTKHIYLKQPVQDLLNQIPDEEMTEKSEEEWKNIQKKLGAPS